MRGNHGLVTLVMLGGIVVLALGLGIVLGTDLFFPAVPFPLIAGAAALVCLLVLRLRGGGPKGPGSPGP